MIYCSLMCQENMFCLLRQSKLLCGQLHPFISNVFPSNQKGKLRANSNQLLGGSLVQLLWANFAAPRPAPWPTRSMVCVSTVWHAVNASGLLYSWMEKMAVTCEKIHTSRWPKLLFTSTFHAGNTTQTLISTGGVTLSPLGHYLQPSA